MKKNVAKKSIELLKELDDLIEKDYQEALHLLEEFKKGTLVMQKSFLEESKNLGIFEDNSSSKYNEYSNR